MKRFLMLLVSAAALAAMAGLATAGDYHVGQLLVCSDCHIAHGSQSHEYTSNNPLANPPTGAHPYLLRGETISNACLTCHDGRADMPDVLGAATGGGPTHGRSAGALNVLDGNAFGYTNTDGYTMGGGHTLWSKAVPPGSGDLGSQDSRPTVISSDGLQCSDCHRAHGAKYYRNMMSDVPGGTASYIPKQWVDKEVSYAITLANVTSGSTTNPWVVEKTANGANHYDNDNVQYLEPDQTKSAYGNWCATCHQNFHGNLTATNIETGGEVIRHPTAGVDFAVSGTSAWKQTDATHRLKLMDNTATWDGTNATTMTPSCFTCHKSHGNKNPMGLIFVIAKGDEDPAGTVTAAVGGSIDPRLTGPTRLATMTEEGDGGAYRNLCRNCHGMGRWPTGNPTNLQQ